MKKGADSAAPSSSLPETQILTTSCSAERLLLRPAHRSGFTRVSNLSCLGVTLPLLRTDPAPQQNEYLQRVNKTNDFKSLSSYDDPRDVVTPPSQRSLFPPGHAL
jgi:hypothetical protein